MISIDNLSYRFGGSTVILHNIHLEIKKGERVAILGANGCGKSTLAKLIAGLSRPSTGKLTIDSRETASSEFQANLGKLAGIVFQNPEHQIISINVERELALGLENYGTPQVEIERTVADYLKTFNLENLKGKHPDRLSGGQKQILALASSLILKPRVLILDEPTAHLDKYGKNIFVEFLNRFCDESTTIIYITQNIIEISNFDRVVIMEQGTIAEDTTPSKLLKNKALFEKYKLAYPIMETPGGRKRKSDVNQMALTFSENEKPILKCANLNFGWQNSESPTITNFSLELYPGKVLGLMGPTGCGKSTLALLMAGLLKPDSGDILLHGINSEPKDLIRYVAYQFQSPERGMFADTLYEDVAYGPRNFGKNIEQTDKLVRQAFRMVGLDYDKYSQRSPFRLSGGEARLAAIAGVLACDKEVVILDEPTEELDYSGKLRIAEIINSLKQAGKAVMLISHDEKLVEKMADKISRM